MTRRWLALIVGAFLSPALGYAADYQPARIGEHDTSLAKRIRFPEVEGDFTLFMRCEAKVLPAGAIEELGCYDDEKVDDAFFHAVMLGANGATVTPAQVDGENVAVLMLLSIVFRQQGESRVTAVVPNHGTNAQELGMSYIAPQRYGRNYGYIPRGELGLLWVDTLMSEDGVAQKPQYLKTKFSNKETQRFAKHYITQNSFIPGFADGEPRAMRFVKPIFGYRNGFMWQSTHDRCGSSIVACDETSNATGKPRYVFDD